jgi:SPP1 gp7 family putative phage head morphogenesis protein
LSSLPAKLWPEAGKPTSHYPGWAFDFRIVEHYAKDLAAAHKEAYPNLEDIVRRVLARYPSTVSKAKHSARANRLAMEQEIRNLFHLDPDALLAVLRDIYGDAYLAGAHAAMLMLESEGLQGAQLVSGVGGLATSIDWSAWSPGWAEAANELAGVNGGLGLERLLINAGVRISGITGTDLSRLATVLADGVSRGDSIDTITKAVLGLLGDTNRAEMIAWTETARAMSAASLDTYQANGIQRWNWLISSGACPECASEALSNPHPLTDDMPPAHPRCRCAASPVVTVAAGTSDASAVDILDNAVGD